jgi:hypothetical protein
MQMTEVRELQKRWQGKQCNHPAFDKVYRRGSDSGNQACTQCGQIFTVQDLDKLAREGGKDSRLGNNGVVEFLMSDKKPYLLSILVVALGFVLTFFAGRFSDNLALEYSIASRAGQMRCEITNISPSTNIEQFEIAIWSNKGFPEDANPDISVPPPYGFGRNPFDYPRKDGSSIFYTIPKMLPGERLLLVATSANSASGFRLSVNTDQPLHIVQRSFSTWIQKNYPVVMAALGVLLAFLVVGYLGVLLIASNRNRHR